MDHSREIRQLWVFAKHYFEEAVKLKNKRCGLLDMRLTGIMDFYENGIPKEDYQIELSLLVAHLNSAAIRLCTINERLHKDLGLEIIKDYQYELGDKRKLENERQWTVKYLEEELIGNIKEYLPHMLRDNVAHSERDTKSKLGILWDARQNVIESLKIIEVFTYMQSAMGVFERNLRDMKFIS